jgi:hypothetical protein
MFRLYDSYISLAVSALLGNHVTECVCHRNTLEAETCLSQLTSHLQLIKLLDKNLHTFQNLEQEGQTFKPEISD